MTLAPRGPLAAQLEAPELGDLTRATTAVMEGRYGDAAPLLLEVVAAYPLTREGRQAADLFLFVAGRRLTVAEVEGLGRRGPFPEGRLVAALVAWKQGDVDGAIGLVGESLGEEPEHPTRLLGEGLRRLAGERQPGLLARAWEEEHAVSEIALWHPEAAGPDAPPGRLIALRRSPPALLRLGRRGTVLEEIAFEPPRPLRPDASETPLTVLPNGSLAIGESLFDRTGATLRRLPYRQAYDLATGLDGEILHLGSDGLRIFDPGGQELLHLAPGHLSAAASNQPRRIAAGGWRLAVAGTTRLWLLDPAGAVLWSGEPPLAAPESPATIADLGLDGDGNVYLATRNPERIQVLSPAGELLYALPLAARRLAVDRDGTLYVLAGRRLAAYRPPPVPLPRQPPDPEPPAEDLTRLGTVRFHTSSRRVRHLAADPAAPRLLWLATAGGVVSYDRENGAWRKWTRREGLPDRDVRAIAFDAEGRVLAFTARGIGRLDPGGDRFAAVRGPGIGRLVADPESADLLWTTGGDGRVRRFDRRRRSWTTVASPKGLRDVVPLPEGGLAVVTEDRLLRLRDGRPEELLRLDGLAPEQAAAIEVRSALRPQTLSFDAAGEELWIGSRRQGFVVCSLATGDLRQPSWNPEAARCADPRVQRVGERRLVYGKGCLAAIDGDRWRLLYPGTDFYALLADPRDPGPLWAGTDRGLARLTLGDSGEGIIVEWMRPPFSEPDGNRVEVLAAAGGRLWVGSADAGLSHFDPQTDRWTSFPGLGRVDLVRASGDQLLVGARGNHCPEGPDLFWLDLPTATVRRRDCRLGRFFAAVADVEPDGEALWAVGSLRSTGEPVLGRVGPDGFQSWPRAGDSRPDRGPLGSLIIKGQQMWRVTGAGELRRFDPETGRDEAVREGVLAVCALDQDHLWLAGPDSGILDRRSRDFVPVAVDGRLVADPETSSRGWGLRAGELVEVELLTGRILRRFVLPRGGTYGSIAALGGRLFLGSEGGIVEISPPADR